MDSSNDGKATKSGEFHLKCHRSEERTFHIELVASRSQRVSLIVIPFCLSVGLDVCQSFRDLQPTKYTRLL